MAWRAFQGEGTLVHLERDEIHSVNAAATLLIERLKGGATVEELAAALCSEFEVDEETARRDAVAFIEQLRESDVVEDVEVAGAGVAEGTDRAQGEPDSEAGNR